MQEMQRAAAMVVVVSEATVFARCPRQLSNTLNLRMLILKPDSAEC